MSGFVIALSMMIVMCFTGYLTLDLFRLYRLKDFIKKSRKPSVKKQRKDPVSAD